MDASSPAGDSVPGERAVIVSAVAPYPTDAGKKVVLAGIVDYLVRRLGPDEVHYVLVGPQPTSPMPVPVHRIEPPRAVEQLSSVLLRTVATGRRSLQESSLYATRVRRALDDLLAELRPDLVVYDTIRMGQYVPRSQAPGGGRRIIYLDDLFSVRYQRILEAQRDHEELTFSALGEFRQVLPGPARRVADNARVQRGLLQVERRLVARREATILRDFDAALLVSPTETARLRALTGSDRVHTLPPVLDAEPPPRRYAGPPVYLLLGLLSLPHNHDAVLTFLRTAMPELLRRQPDAQVQVVGRGATPEIEEAAAPYGENVVVRGYVPDLDGLMARCCALLVPLRFGSGIKIKVLEALAHGVPVLATPVGAEGIEAGEHRGILVEPELARFPEHMSRLTDSAWNAELSARAQRHHRSTYAPQAAHAHYDEVFGFSERVH
jgi:glycosyltransferase involved in cell wall biosynthesis